jgi:hypothetical protein
VAQLTPLGTWAMRELLIEEDVEIPLLAPPGQMTAADLLGEADELDEDESVDSIAQAFEPRPSMWPWRTRSAPSRAPRRRPRPGALQGSAMPTGRTAARPR